MRALVLSGGGAKGAFSAGVICQLGQTQQGLFDIYAGTSTGALLAVLALAQQYEKISYWYQNITSADLLTRRCPVTALLFSDSLYKTDKFYELLKKEMPDDLCRLILGSERLLLLAAIDYATGNLTCFTNKNITLPKIECLQLRKAQELRLAIMASSAQPVFMPLVEIRGQQYADGGLRDVSPLKPAIAAGATEILAIDNNALATTSYPGNASKIPEILERGLDFMTTEILQNDFHYAIMINESLKAFTEMQRSAPLSLPNFLQGKGLLNLKIDYPPRNILGSSLDFDKQKMRTLFQMGYEHKLSEQS